MVVVDTTVWVDYLRGTDTPETTWLGQELTLQRIGLVDLMLCEVLLGLQDDKEAARVLKYLNTERGPER